MSNNSQMVQDRAMVTMAN